MTGSILLLLRDGLGGGVLVVVVGKLVSDIGLDGATGVVSVSVVPLLDVSVLVVLVDEALVTGALDNAITGNGI